MQRHQMVKQGIVLAGVLSLLSGLAYADRDHDRWEHRDHWRSAERHERGDYDRHRNLAAPSKGFREDRRYDHDRYYPRPGYAITNLPPQHVVVRFHDDRYFFHGGIWYRPVGARFVVVAPPIGIVVPILPAFYTTLWYNGIPYYYANNVYYVWNPARDGYVVTQAPPQLNDEDVQLQPQQLYIYPMHGQSEKQQADDRFECYRWSVKQTGFDPTTPPQDSSQSEINRQRKEYRRAMTACLEGRGYSVR